MHRLQWETSDLLVFYSTNFKISFVYADPIVSKQITYYLPQIWVLISTQITYLPPTNLGAHFDCLEYQSLSMTYLTLKKVDAKTFPLSFLHGINQIKFNISWRSLQCYTYHLQISFLLWIILFILSWKFQSTSMI